MDCASKNGNYLLNVGPTAEGIIPEPSARRLEEMGEWLRMNGESIFGTKAERLQRLPWARCTEKGDTLYLHVFEWPADGRVGVPDLGARVAFARLLGGEALDVTTSSSRLVIQGPHRAPDAADSVIALRLA